MVGVVRIDPERVVVAVDTYVVGMGLGDQLEAPATVLALEGTAAQDVDPVRFVRVDEDLRVVHGPGIQVAHLVPAVPPVTRAVGPGPFVGPVLDGRHQHGGIGRGHREADPPLVTRRDAPGELGPTLSPVATPEDPASRSSAVETPSPAEPLVHRGVDDVGVRRVQGQVCRSRPLVRSREHLPPVPAAVGRLVDAALLGPPPEVALRRHPGDVRVVGMNHHPSDMAGLLQSQVSPAVAPVVRAINAVAPGRALPGVLLPGSGVDDAGMRRGNRHIAEGAHRHGVEDVRPGVAPVGGLPEAARGGGRKDR